MRAARRDSTETGGGRSSSGAADTVICRATFSPSPADRVADRDLRSGGEHAVDLRVVVPDEARLAAVGEGDDERPVASPGQLRDRAGGGQGLVGRRAAGETARPARHSRTARSRGYSHSTSSRRNNARPPGHSGSFDSGAAAPYNTPFFTSDLEAAIAMTKRWSEAELRFLKDNAEKMSVQALADALSVRIDELEKKMEKLGLLGGAADAPAPKKAQTLQELSKHTENARKDYDRGVAALQKKKLDEAERHFLDLIQKYPEERELVDRARVYLTGLRAAAARSAPGPDRARGLLLRGGSREEPRQRRRGDRAPQPRRPQERRRQGRLPARVLLRAAGRSRDGARRTSGRRSRKTSGTACSRATTGTSIRCARPRSSRSCWLPRPDRGRASPALY